MLSARRRLTSLGLRTLSGFTPCSASYSHINGICTLQLYSTVPSTHLATTRPWKSNGSIPKYGFWRSFAAAALPSHSELAMPALSPTMSQGNIVSWKKKEGDSVQPGDIYCEVETDKATIEWEAQEEGFIAKILVPEGTKNIDIGKPVAILVEEEADIAAFKDYQPGSSTPSASTSQAEEQTSSSSNPATGSFPQHEVVAMPALSPTMSQGNIISWKKNEGDEVAPGDILAEVETDKATIEWEAQEEGVIAKILVPGGSSGVDVGSPVMIMVDEKNDVALFSTFTMANALGGAADAAPSPSPPSPPPSSSTPSVESSSSKRSSPPATTTQVAAGDRVIASPYAKKLAADANISLAGVGGSGPKGRIVAADVQQLIASGGAVPSSSSVARTGQQGGFLPSSLSGTALSAYTDEEATQIRKITARRLLESKQQIPHYYLTISCRIDRLTAIRQQLNATLASSSSMPGTKVSVNDFIIKASALALRKVPEVNASWHGDFIRQYHTVDCSVAVQTPIGLMVPIVRDADKKGLATISTEVRDLATRAKEGKLRPEEFTGGTFTVSNLGMFGVTQFAAIVNPPQACILAVGGAEKKVVPSEGEAGGFEQGTFVNVTMSCDHRVVDGAVGAQWLQAFKGFIEDPASMLL